MGFDLRLPNITGATEKEQLAQMKSYMHQLVEQLNWAMGNIDTIQSNGTYTVTQRGGSTMPSDQNKAPTVDFSTIKALIIKSADIVNAYYEQMMERFEGAYFAESDFGTYLEKTAQDISKNSTDITQAFTNTQTVYTNLNANIAPLVEQVGTLDEKVQDVKDGVEKGIGDLNGKVDGLGTEISDYKDATDERLKGAEEDIGKINGVLAVTEKVVEVNATIRTGLLNEDNGIPVYGLEIGQKNFVDGEEVFNKYARFTADRLSFYDKNGYEVAYISDKKLSISHVEITGSFAMGGFVDTVQSNGNIVTKWV